VSVNLASPTPPAALPPTYPVKCPMSSEQLNAREAKLLLIIASDQIYWDRIHIHVPIIHQRRYMGWSRKQDKSEARKCLQLAMWTVAASTSPGQYQTLANYLYKYASQSLLNLESWDSAADEWSQMRPNDFVQIQAQLLLAFYEFKSVDFRRGWMRAGRAFRLIQLNWFYDMLSTSSSMSDWVEAEERRRTFWVAFCLDRTISLRNDAPCTFNEPVSIGAGLGYLPPPSLIRGFKVTLGLTADTISFFSTPDIRTITSTGC
jgi:hypothetical protein